MPVHTSTHAHTHAGVGNVVYSHAGTVASVNGGVNVKNRVDAILGASETEETETEETDESRR